MTEASRVQKMLIQQNDEINRLRNRIEKLEAALDDVAGYLARADWYYLKPETRKALEPQSYRGQQDDSALKADHPTALSAEDIRKMNHE